MPVTDLPRGRGRTTSPPTQPDEPRGAPVLLGARRRRRPPAGFAGILHEGLDGLTVDEVLAVPEDAPYRFSLGEAVSPLRLRGMVGDAQPDQAPGGAENPLLATDSTHEAATRDRVAASPLARLVS